MNKKLRRVPVPEPENLTLEYCDPLDPTLPSPRGSVPPQRSVNPHEANRLQRTHELGGLVPDRIHTQYWQCSQCHLVHETRELAIACHQSGATQAQRCKNCGKRFADCTCR
jgi:hypothetical protein